MFRAATLVVMSTLMVFVAGMADVAGADVPTSMNYQVMLTDGSNNPLENQTVTLQFRLYTVSSGGSSIWSETQVATTNPIGVVSVMLGSNTPLNVEDFEAPLWLEVVVDGDVMSPRRQLVSAPYALHAASADFPCDPIASIDGVSNECGNIDLIAGANVSITPNDASNTITIAASSDPVTPGDGIDISGSQVSVDVTDVAGDGLGEDGSNNLKVNTSTGLEISGDNVQLTSAYQDGDPYDGRFVNEGQSNSVTTAMVTPNIVSSVEGVTNDGGNIDLIGAGTVSISHDDGANTITITGSSGPVTAGDGIDVSGSEVSVDVSDFAGSGLSDDGSNNLTIGTGAITYPRLDKTMSFNADWDWDMNGDYLAITGDGGIPLLDVRNTTGSGGFGDCIWLQSTSSTAEAASRIVFANTKKGNAGWFEKQTDDNAYALHVEGVTSSSEGLSVYGTITSTSLRSRTLETSRGVEPVFPVESPDADMYVSGTAQLSAGEAYVSFDRLFSESVSRSVDLHVTATPRGAWSGLYVASRDADGFVVRSDAGDPNVEFDWVACGRSKGFETRQEVTLPDREAVEAARELAFGKPAGAE